MYSRMASVSYRDAGLDLDLYEQTLAGLPPLLRRTHSPRVLDGFGGFASLFSLDYNSPAVRPQLPPAGPRHLHRRRRHQAQGRRARRQARHRRHRPGRHVGQRLPLHRRRAAGVPRLPRHAEGRPGPDARLVKGISDGCIEADCALTGGETAILPDFYQPGDYDLAGFCVGVVERDHIINGKAIQVGDVVLGLASSGLHSNGYSLVRKIVFDVAGLKVTDFVPELGRTVGEELLEPTRIYVRPIRNMLEHYPVKRRVVRGLAHITGGGLVDNLPRILPPGRRAFLKRGSWPVPPVFALAATARQRRRKRRWTASSTAASAS